MYTAETHTRVRYAETDRMGYVYYGTYAQYYEIGRVEALRSLGLSYRDLEEHHGIWLPVVSLEARYLRPAFYDERLTIKTEIRKLPDQYITFHSSIYNERGELLNAGTVRLCFFDASSKKAVPAPGFVLELFRPFFDAPE